LVAKALRVCACFVVLLTFDSPVHAEWYVTPFIGITFKGSTTFFDPENVAAGEQFGERNHRVLGAAVTHIGRRPLGIEGILAVVPGIFDRGEATAVLSSGSTVLMGNLFLAIPRDWSEHGLRPFVSGGFGLLRVVKVEPGDVLSVRRNVMGYNIGGGAFGPLSDRTGVRFEVRRFAYVKPSEFSGFSFGDERLSYWAANVGVVIRLR
jgi:hypothetical protein